jgi:hypothetical protein
MVVWKKPHDLSGMFLAFRSVFNVASTAVLPFLAQVVRFQVCHLAIWNVPSRVVGVVFHIVRVVLNVVGVVLDFSALLLS